MNSNLNFHNVNYRSPAVVTAIGVGATVVIALMVVITLLLAGSAITLSDNAALIGALLALGGVFTAQMVGIALEAQRAHEASLQNYFKEVGKLLIEKPLRKARPGDNLSTVVRAQTLAVLEGLDSDRKRILLQFLYESKLIHRYTLAVSLVSANLSEANLGVADLFRADLSEANLSRANLREANLRECHLYGVNLHGASLLKANLFRADLPRADLSEADLSEANLSRVSLLRANLRETNLSGANLRRSTLSGAELRGINLSGANLNEATGVTNEKLEQHASSLEGAIMPDGSTHS
jgi:uncharacterized protein YjbI with pentapeptide repeats